MGICSVLAIIPFLCSAPAEEPPAEEEEQVIEAQPAPEVAMGMLTPPPPTSHQVSDYQVLPPSRTSQVAAPRPQGPPQTPDADSFSEWVNQNWGDDRDSVAVTTAYAAPEPRLDLGVMAEPSLELYDAPSSEPALVRLEPPTVLAYEQTNRVSGTSELDRVMPAFTPAPQPELVLMPEPVVAPEPAPEPAMVPEPMFETQMAMNHAARPMPEPDAEKAEEIVVAASMGGAWNAGAALADGSIGFAEPEAFTRRGQQVETDGIAARKRRQTRRVERELRRLARDRGE